MELVEDAEGKEASRDGRSAMGGEEEEYALSQSFHNIVMYEEL